MIYLATPYSDPDPRVMEFRFNAVNEVAGMLMNSGLYVYSPISHSHPIAQVGGLPGSWEFWKEYDQVMMSVCDELCIYTAYGWEKSVGVFEELNIALKGGKKISYIGVGEVARVEMCGHSMLEKILQARGE